MMLNVIRSTQFKKDLKKILKQRKNLDLLVSVMTTLQNGEALPIKNKDHLLVGNWAGHRECHILPNWLLIYKIDTDTNDLILARTGSHAELFG